MKKTALLLLLLSILAFTSCGSDDDDFSPVNNAEKLIGNWESTNIWSDVKGNNAEFAKEIKAGMDAQLKSMIAVYSFKEDNTYSTKMSFIVGAGEEEGTFEVKQGKIYLTSTSGEKMTYQCFFDGNKLRLIVDAIDTEIDGFDGLSLRDLGITKFDMYMDLAKK